MPAAIIDFTDSSRDAFVRGFLKGMAAPVLLFHEHTVPPLPQVAPVQPPPRPDGDAGALAADWARVAAGVWTALERHVQEHAPVTSVDAGR